MNLNPSFLFCFIRSFPALSLTFFLLLHHFLHPEYLNYQLSVYTYSLCGFVLAVESLFLFFYKDRDYPKAVELGLLFLSAVFLSSLLVTIKVPTALFFIFTFFFIQTLSLIFLKQIFQAAVYFIYLTLLFPLFLSADYQSLEQGHFLIPFSLLIFTFLFLYLLVFYFSFHFLNKKTPETMTFNSDQEDQIFHLTLISEFSRKLKPFLKQVSRHSSLFKNEMKKNKFLLNQNNLEKQMDWTSQKKIQDNIDSLNTFISGFIEYIELFFEKINKEFVSLDGMIRDSLKELENHPQKPDGLNLKNSLESEKHFETFASAEHLKKVFKQIIINAFEAYNFNAEAPKLHIHISSSRGWLIIYFIDEGQGIEAEDEQKVFTPFESKKFGLRAGLGLSYAKKAIELHQGTIEIKREDNKTKVIVRLPLIESKKTNPFKERQANPEKRKKTA